MQLRREARDRERREQPGEVLARLASAHGEQVARAGAGGTFVGRAGREGIFHALVHDDRLAREPWRMLRKHRARRPGHRDHVSRPQQRRALPGEEEGAMRARAEPSRRRERQQVVQRQHRRHARRQRDAEVPGRVEELRAQPRQDAAQRALLPGERQRPRIVPRPRDRDGRRDHRERREPREGDEEAGRAARVAARRVRSDHEGGRRHHDERAEEGDRRHAQREETVFGGPEDAHDHERRGEGERLRAQPAERGPAQRGQHGLAHHRPRAGIAAAASAPQACTRSAVASAARYHQPS